MSNLLVISHYTLHTPYVNEVKKLVSSLIKVGVEYEVRGIPTLGSWRANSNYCVEHILSMMEKHPDKRLLRVDADAIFFKYPSLFDDPKFDADLSAFYGDVWGKGYIELLGGTVYVANTEASRILMEKWKKRCDIDPSTSNQKTLRAMYREGFGDVKFTSLPAEYCKIFDSSQKMTSDPVIVHYQCSRKYRRVMG